MKMNFLLLIVTFTGLSIAVSFVIRLVVGPLETTLDQKQEQQQQQQQKPPPVLSRETRAAEDPGVHNTERQTREYVHRFPYLVAILREADDSNWSYACAGALVLARWAAAAGHCARGRRHRVVRFKDAAQGRDPTYPVLYWKTSPANGSGGVALARVDVGSARLPTARLPTARLGRPGRGALVAAGWRGARRLPHPAAAAEFEAYPAAAVAAAGCEPVFGARATEHGALCVELSRYNCSLAYEFGPLFAGDRLAGVLWAPPPAAPAAPAHPRLALFTSAPDHRRWLVAAARGEP